MRQFSIKELEHFSGIRSHTIRTWEKRYHIFTPDRSISNIRSYNVPDLKRIMDISLLLRFGYRISALAFLNANELEQRVSSLKIDEARKENLINTLIGCMFSNDIDLFEIMMESAIMIWRLRATIQEIILPFLDRTRILSYNDSSVEVHLVVTAVRRKLILGIEKASPPASDAKTALLFLPKGEHYDLILLYISYVLKEQGVKVLYLGTNISLENLERMALEKSPDYIYTQLVTHRNFPLEDYVELVRRHLPGSKLCIAHAEKDMHYRLDSSIGQFFRYNSLGRVI